MLPKDGNITRHQTEAVRSKLRRLIEDTKASDSPVTLTRVSQEVDYQPSTLSQWLSGKYRGKNELVTRAVNAWIEREARRRESQSTREYVPTWVCEQMMMAARAAYRLERMAAIVAPSGSGKDMVIDYLVEELNGYALHCHSKMSAVALVRALATKVGISERRVSCAELLDNLCDRIRDKNCTIFLNEAQNLPPDAAGIILSIYNETGVPMLMFGSDRIFDLIDDRDGRAAGGGQFHRRCKKVNILDRLSREEDPDQPGKLGRPLYSIDEIREFVRMKQISLAGDDVLAMAWSVANLAGWGTLGFLNVILEGIADAWPDEVVTCDHLVAQILDETADEADDILVQADAIERPASLRQQTA